MCKFVTASLTNQLIDHLIVIKQPERFIKSSSTPDSMNVLTINEPAKIQ